MAKWLPRVSKVTLVLIAGLVWFIAGFNIVRIGLMAATKSWSLVSAGAALAVFLLFFLLIFRRLVKKHTNRIMAYEQERLVVFRFFDVKSYILMACMMTFGIVLRRSNWWPPDCITMFYTGLGSALMAAGIGFVWKFIALRRRTPCVEQRAEK